MPRAKKDTGRMVDRAILTIGLGTGTKMYQD
jgi:hypothetical protein